MTSTFDTFFERAVQYEGKVCEDVPGDLGGPTKWGVTIGRLATCKGVREPKRGTQAFEDLKAELFALTEAQIKSIYRKDYWDAVRGDDLPAGVSFCVADFGLNSGPSRAVRYVQKLCGRPQTGTMDDATVREVNGFQAVEMIMLYCDERARFLNAIVDGTPSQRKFLRGWLNRVGDVRRAALADAEQASIPVAVAQPMPKAEEPVEAGPVATATKSWTVRWGAAGMLAWAEDQFGMLKGLLPDMSDAAREVAGPLESLGHLLKTNMSKIIAVATIAILVVMIYRHVTDKRELNRLRRA